MRTRITSLLGVAAAALAVTTPAAAQKAPLQQIGKGEGFFYEPTVIAGACQEDEIVKLKVFGRWSA
ncbi:MAG TPA: hypothetical protein PL196_10425 [Burkholderiaceae bacterium]|nr:hypothetical protein [Burkholderiaceae bacterium]